MKIAGVAVEGAAIHFDREYSYLIPPELASALVPGCRVKVCFGRGRLLRQGVVLSIKEEPGPEGLKPVVSLLDPEPLIDGEGLAVLRYLKEQTFCTFFDALRLLIPTGLSLVFETLYAAVPAPAPTLNPVWRDICDYLKKLKRPAGEEALVRRFSVKGSELDAMAATGMIERLEKSKSRIMDEKVTMVRLLAGYEELELTPRQKKAVLFLQENESASLKELCYFTGVTRAVAEGLRKKGAAEFYDRVIPRNPYGDRDIAPSPPPLLSPGQQAALDGLTVALDNPEKPALLYGVTGSGKTMVYLALIERVLALGKGAIVLVPEISLTAQTVEGFHARFGQRVAVVHSGLSLGERTDEWRRIKNGGACIVVGTRSAVFAPVKNLGLIVVDEEQEHTYKSDKAPRYHAKDIARLRCSFNGALALFASATPSVESYHEAKSGKSSLFTLGERFGRATLPEVKIADMRDSAEMTDTPSVGATLREELYLNLTRGEQSILLLNRRGHSTLIRCSSCGEVAECPNCSVSMTYHAANGALLCHYCGHQAQKSETCPKCGSSLVRYSGLGTQKRQEELLAAFPEARVLRVDMDTTMSRQSHERLFGAFSRGEYDIMVGTQMVAKGLNFPRVTLVGVLAIDQSLYADDFRSYERAFSLLTQVVGRGGRSEAGGRAVIQTFCPGHPVIYLGAAQDYPAFFADEDYSRKIHLYPPYCKMAGIGFASADQKECLEAANAFLSCLCSLAAAEYHELPLRMLGPSPAGVYRAAGKYRYKIILKCKNNKRTRELIARVLNRFYSEKRQVSVFVDMYYDNM
ncbi:MAG: primosomal protein N' [Oscillospiraceae bacterium]|nr:primosomal protein N' [Oscillospiraceae bacterium]